MFRRPDCAAVRACDNPIHARVFKATQTMDRVEAILPKASLEATAVGVGVTPDFRLVLARKIISSATIVALQGLSRNAFTSSKPRVVWPQRTLLVFLGRMARLGVSFNDFMVDDAAAFTFADTWRVGCQR